MDRLAGARCHHPVTGPDEEKANQLCDVENFNDTRPGERPTDAGKDGSDCDQQISSETGTRVSFTPVPHRGPHGATDEKYHGVQVHDGREQPNPLPSHHLSGEPVRLDQFLHDRRCHHEGRGHGDVGDHGDGESVGPASGHHEIDSPLREWSRAEEGAGYVPGSEHWLAPAKYRRDGFGERPHPVQPNSDHPPQEIASSRFPSPMSVEDSGEGDGHQGGDDRKEMKEIPFQGGESKRIESPTASRNGFDRRRKRFDAVSAGSHAASSHSEITSVAWI